MEGDPEESPGPLPKRAAKRPHKEVAPASASGTDGGGAKVIALPPPPPKEPQEKMEAETEAQSRGASPTMAPPVEEGEPNEGVVRPEGVDSEADIQPLNG